MQEMRIYLLNNTKPYREGDEEYSGAWFNCPVDFEEIREKIGVEHEEQIEIADYELPFDLHSDTQLWEINANCRMVLELEGPGKWKRNLTRLPCPALCTSVPWSPCGTRAENFVTGSRKRSQVLKLLKTFVLPRQRWGNNFVVFV